MNLRHQLQLSLALERLRLHVEEGRELMDEIEARVEEIGVLLRTACDNATGADNGRGYRKGLAGDDGVRERVDVARLVRDGSAWRDVK